MATLPKVPDYPPVSWTPRVYEIQDALDAADARLRARIVPQPGYDFEDLVVPDAEYNAEVDPLLAELAVELAKSPSPSRSRSRLSIQR